MKKIFLSVVIPAYNEVKNINAGVLFQVYEYLKKQKYTWEVLLVDDGSTDNTVNLLTKFQKNRKNFKVLKEPHRGKAGTVIAGMLNTKGEIVLFTDMDQATPLNQIENFFPEFEKGKDLVIGSRLGREGYSTIRKIMALGFVSLRKIILGLPFKDTQCGFKAFKNSKAREIFKRMKVFNDKARSKGAAVTAGFDLEILYIARKLNLKVSEVTVDWHEKGLRKEVSPIKDSYEGLRDLIKVRLNALTGQYKTRNI
ncbi:glycosyltransferase [Candidatus Woesebacteria bacterium]|nr:glycosyltransferase [Candidatus Woesebacteria bacterium]QQG47026.1 MAG: glycosyltransferase [Candidatus Woesebacteria bacterium]